MFSVDDFISGGLIIYSSILLGFVLFLRKVISAKNLRKLPLPPGPKGLPIFGNISDLPPTTCVEWQHWLKHKNLYGPISSVTVFGQTVILIHDRDIASELLDKRSAKYSSRPTMQFASEMIGYKDSTAMMEYNDRLRMQRKMVAKQIGSKNLITKFFPSIESHVRRFLLQTMNSPQTLHKNLQLEAASFTLDMVYGYQVNPSGDDPLVNLVTQLMTEFCDAAVAGVWLVDMIPWLKYLPGWFPGAGFKSTARRYRATYMQAINTTFDFTEKQMAQGSQKDSYVAGLLYGNPSLAEIKEIKNSAVALYGGGSDTTVASLSNFFLAMSLYPEVQMKAQREIDRVIGAGRLPDLHDRENLPYIEAVFSETLRWMPIVPLSLPHASVEEDEFRGYRIPKGSIILPSIAWFAIDPATYKQPESFIPERFLGPSELDPRKYVFGFGRRICPGRYLADANIFLMIAQSLAAFHIGKAVDLEGKDIEPVVGQLPGIVSHPIPYQCTIRPRSEKYKELVSRVETEHPLGKGDSEFIEGL
ncbi:hypothetical protein TWF718_000397 [Orbilia javanica]|uniref:Cytochrome P450 n=1 Tax=Orbilia javanica TaxID=47235 RepID=A0AAN8RFU8_9PEZI